MYVQLRRIITRQAKMRACARLVTPATPTTTTTPSPTTTIATVMVTAKRQRQSQGSESFAVIQHGMLWTPRRERGAGRATVLAARAQLPASGTADDVYCRTCRPASAC